MLMSLFCIFQMCPPCNPAEVTPFSHHFHGNDVDISVTLLLLSCFVRVFPLSVLPRRLPLTTKEKKVLNGIKLLKNEFITCE